MNARRALLVCLLVAATVPYFVGLGSTSIIDANEAFYTETPREMIEAGDYLNPTFNYEPRFNKPPLSYWIVAGFYRAFGISLGSARLPIALGALVLLATVFLLGRIAFSTNAGLVAAITLAATPRFLLFSRRIIIDIYTAAFLGLTLLFFVLAETEPTRRRQWLVAMYVAAGFGVLTKGPVAVLLPALVFTAYLFATGRLATIRRMLLPAGTLIVAVIVVPYYAALYAQHGWTYIKAFVVQENLARFAEGVGAPSRGPLFYLPVVFADLYFPWSLLLLAGLALVPWRRAWRWEGWRSIWSEPEADRAATSDQLRLLLGCWIVLIVGFFSASRGQQDLYVLPFVVAGAPLVGGLLDGLATGSLSPRLAAFTRWSTIFVALVLVVLGGLVALLVGGEGGTLSLAGARMTGIVLAAGAAASLGFSFRRAYSAAIAAMVGGVIVGHMVLVEWILPDFERYKPMPQLSRAIQQVASPHARVATYRVTAPSLVFYLQRHISFIMDEEQVLTFLREHPDAYCVMREDDYRVVGPKLGPGTRVLAEAPVFEARLRDFLTLSALPRMVVVTSHSPDAPTR
jgi:4-amino-4-deoxy-L-arabinose transferase-like glycosyltransferase